MPYISFQHLAGEMASAPHLHSASSHSIVPTTLGTLPSQHWVFQQRLEQYSSWLSLQRSFYNHVSCSFFASPMLGPLASTYCSNSTSEINCLCSQVTFLISKLEPNAQIAVETLHFAARYRRPLSSEVAHCTGFLCFLLPLWTFRRKLR